VDAASSVLYVDRSDVTAEFEPPRQDDLAPLSGMSAKIELDEVARPDLWPAITIGRHRPHGCLGRRPAVAICTDDFDPPLIRSSATRPGHTGTAKAREE
jgi:hypothetical protein